MMIKYIFQKYYNKLDHLDLELLVAHTIKKSREFVLAHPEYEIRKAQSAKLKRLIERRLKHEPIAYILGQKEFYGLNFKVNKATLIPRPETEQIIDLVTYSMKHKTKDKKTTFIDVGTGSGNIIIAIAKSLKLKTQSAKFFGIDLSSYALKIAKQNAKINKVGRKIKFLHGNLLQPLLKDTGYKIQDTRYIILANLPYLSQKIYQATMPDVKKFEPRSALLSGKDGLNHYRKLLKQIKQLKEKCFMLHISCFIEISPEQRKNLEKMVRKYFPRSKLEFYRDLAKKWRILELKL